MKSLFTKSTLIFQNSQSLTSLSLLLFCFFMVSSKLEADDDGIRVIAGMRSADALIEELEHMVSKLAGRTDSYENNIFPNIDIFLIGVDTGKPIRFDPIFSEQNGMELRPLIPLDDLDDFLDDNLDPIGIIPKRNRRDRELYELTGNVFEGWLRVLKDPEYVVIFPRKEAIPKGMDHPSKLHKALVEKGYTFFAELDNSNSTPAARKSAFDKMAKNTIEGIQKRPTESLNTHALRKAILDQQLSMLQQWFVECSGLTIGSHLDKGKNVALFNLLFAALEETQLQKDLARATTEPSYFAAVAPVEKSILTTRIHFMLNDQIVEKLVKVYQLIETVTKEDLEENKDLTANEKKARTNLAVLLNKIVTESADLQVLDGILDIVPSGDANAFVLGLRCKGQADINSAIDEILASRKEMKLTKDVADVEGVKVHKLELGDKAPAALKELYGSSYDTVYLAVSDKAFWLAFGENAQQELSQRIQTARTSKDAKSDGVIFTFNAQVAPLVKSLNGLLKDKESFIGSFYDEQQTKRTEQKEAEEKDENSEDGRPAQEAATNFMTLEWVDKIIGTMDGEDDTVKFEMKVNEAGAIDGTGAAHQGILKAVGVMIANFADENLQ